MCHTVKDKTFKSDEVQRSVYGTLSNGLTAVTYATPSEATMQLRVPKL
jgi:hypothetical protein